MRGIDIHAQPSAHASCEISCELCIRTLACSAEDLDRFADEGWPRCCGQVMSLVELPEGESVVSPLEGSGTRKEKRRWRRRPARRGSRVEVRRGLLGLGPDLGVELVDATEFGLRVRIKERLEEKQEVEVALHGPSVGKPIKGSAEVLWCHPDPEGNYRAGLRLRFHLSYAMLSNLVR